MRVCDGIWKTRQGRRQRRCRRRDRRAGWRVDDELDGPFDIDDFDDPATATVARLDLGSVLIPMPEAGQVQVELTEGGVPSAVWVVTPNGRFTVAAYAAPKTAALWREVATELADSLRKDAAQVQIEDGPWGREVVGAAPAGRGPVHRRRRLPVDDPLRRERPAGDHRSAERARRGKPWRTRSFVAATRPCRFAPRCRCSCPSRWPRSCRAAAEQAAQQAANQPQQQQPPQTQPVARRSEHGSAMQQLRTITGG